MTSGSRLGRACRAFAIAVALAAVAAPAVASPGQVLADYLDNGAIDCEYSVSDLRGSLRLVQRGGAYDDFSGAVSARLAERLAGRSRDAAAGCAGAPAQAPPDKGAGTPSVTPATPAPAPPPGGAIAEETSLPPVMLPNDIPGPPASGPDEPLPMAFVALAGLACLLALAGAGVALIRRIRS